MAITLYSVSLLTHILSVVLWLSTIPILFVIDKAVKSYIDKPESKFKLVKMSSINIKIAVVAAVLVFLSGSLLVESGGFGWAPSSGAFWLVTKQTIWLILLVASIFVLRPLDNKLNLLITEGNEDAVFDHFKKIKMSTHILNTFVIINIILVTLKPF